MAADKSDEQGVLGNLPRSRPGHRSEKRGASAGAKSGGAKSSARAGGKRAKPAARAGSTSAKSTSRPKPSARPKSAARDATPPRPQREPSRPEPETSGSTDPFTGAVRLAGKVAEVGLKTAGGLLKRLPGR